MSYMYEAFPSVGEPWQNLESELLARRTDGDDTKWNDPKNLKASYFAGDDVVEVAWRAYTMFKGDNLLYSGTLYRSLPTLIDDVINMALGLLHAPEGAGGTITTGGTESILLAIRAAYRRAYPKGAHSGTPEILAPYHVHPAFNKAASLMGLKVVRVPLVDFRADPEAMAEAVTDNTFMIVGSAPAYPLGHVDPITKLGQVAQEHNLWLHVDACVGGFFLPFASNDINPVPQFDFLVPEVCSISADLHKYGYTARGASLLLLREEALSRFHYFDFNAWPTGAFNTPTLTGSRPAGAVASAWAVMKYLGFEGYRDRAEKILESKGRIVKSAEAVPGIRRCGNPEACIIAFSSDNGLDMLAVRDGMTAKGWQTAAVIDPPGLQALLNYRHYEIADEFGEDLAVTADLVKKGRLTTSGGDLSYGG